MLYAGDNLHTSSNLVIEIEGYSSQEIAFCIKKLHEIDYVDVVDLSDTQGKEYRIIDITPKGYDLIDKLKAIPDKKLIKTVLTYSDLDSLQPSEKARKTEYSKKSRATFIAPIFSGIIVSIIAIFFLSPLKELIFPQNDKSLYQNENVELGNHENKITIDESNNRQTDSKLEIENMSGGVAIGNIENLNVNYNNTQPKYPNAIYKQGVKWGSVINFNINSNNMQFTIDEIEFDKPIRNTNDLFTPFEYKGYILQISRIESVVSMFPPSAKGVKGTATINSTSE